MAKIPPHLLTQVTAPDSAQVSGGAMAATSRALAGTAQGMSQIAGELDRFAHEQQRTENERHIVEARTAMEKEYSDFTMELADKGVPPSEYVKRFDDRMNSFQSTLSREEYSPAVREELKNSFSRFVGSARIRTAEFSIKQNRGQTVMSYENRMRSQMDQGDYQGAEDTAAEMTSGGYLTMPEKERVVSGIKKKERHGLRLAEIQVDPAGELEKIKEGKGLYDNLPVEDKAVYENAARRGVHENKREELSEIDNMMARGDIATPSDVDLMRDAGRFPTLDDATIAKVKSGMARTKPITAQERASWHARQAEYEQARENGADRDTLMKMHNALEMQARSLPSGEIRGNMLKILSSLDPYAEPKDAPRDAKKETILRKIGQDAIYNAMRRGAYGTYHNDPKAKKDSFDQSKNSEKNYKLRLSDNAKAEVKADEMRIKLLEFLETIQNPTSKDVMEFLNTQIGGGAAENAASILEGATAQPDRDSESLLPGLTRPPQ